MKRIIISNMLLLLLFTGMAQNCQEKIKWKKLKTEIEVSEHILKCVPAGSDRKDVEAFLAENNTEFSDYTERIIYASAKGKSGSFFIEKKWLMEFMFDEKGKLIEVKVKAGFTGP